MSLYTLFFAEENSQIPLWAFQSYDLELIAGMLAAGVGIMDDLNAEGNDNKYYVDSDADVSSFRVVTEVEEDLIRSNTLGKFAEDEYGIWMKASRRFYYNLYAFQTDTFFQGVVTMCNTFQVDFRNYIYGFPFDAYGNQLALSGYVMAPYQIAQDAFDLFDVEEEEADDENIIEPLERSDIIITIKDTVNYGLEIYD